MVNLREKSLENTYEVDNEKLRKKTADISLYMNSAFLFT